MPFILDPYQVEFSYNIRRALGQHHKVIACAATGAGKSATFIDLATRAHQGGKCVLILTESRKIFNQIFDSDLHAHKINAEVKEDVWIDSSAIYIAMTQTLSNRQKVVDQLKELHEKLFIIVDEAHIGTFNKLLQQLGEAMLCGFTATPDARWAHHLPKIYETIVVGPQPQELVQLGFLCPCRHFARIGANLDELALQGGDFTEASQEKAFDTTKLFDGLCEDLRTIPYKKCLIFTASVKDCNTVANQLRGKGFGCVAVHRNSKAHPINDKEFEYRLAQYTKGGINICVSVGTLTKGFDFPEIDLVVLRRATTSLPLYLQMMGRGSRKRRVEWKKHFTVLDYGGNYIRHGLWDADRDWDYLWNKPRNSKEGVAPIKMCPQCDYINKVSASSCENCGYEFIKQDIPLEYGKLIEITEVYNNTMVGRRVSTLNPNELAIWSRLKNKKNFATRIARFLDRHKPGYLEDYGGQMNYKYGWVDWQRKINDGDDFNDFTLK